MVVPYSLVFDDVIIKQLQKVSKDLQLKTILTRMFDELELNGPNAGKLLDSHLFIRELKNKHPPLRLYFKHHLNTHEIYIFEFEMKTSAKKQKSALARIRFRSCVY